MTYAAEGFKIPAIVFPHFAKAKECTVIIREFSILCFIVVKLNTAISN
jgi:hypothetical protein